MCVCDLLLLLAVVPTIALLPHSYVLFFVTNTFSLTVAIVCRSLVVVDGKNVVVFFSRKKHNTKKKRTRKKNLPVLHTPSHTYTYIGSFHF